MRPPRWIAVSSAALAASVSSGCAPADPAADLLARATEVRVVEPRWSAAGEHHPCDTLGPGAPGRCAPSGRLPDVSRWIDRVNEVEGVAQGSDSTVTSTVTALRALAAVDVLTAGAGTADLDRAIDRLRGAADLAPGDPDVLADLAAALLVRGAATGRTWDLAAALEAAEMALRGDSRHAAASFNRALALDRLQLSGEAVRAWEGVAAAANDDGWAREARIRRDAVEARLGDGVEPVPQVDLLVRELAGLLVSDLPEPDAGEAWAWLRRRADDLAARGERGALDLLEAVEGVDGVRGSRLVEAVRRYVEAMDLWRAGAFAASQAMYRRSGALANGESPGAQALGWRAEIGAARWSVYDGKFAEAEAGFGGVLDRIRGVPAAETRGHALWGLGLSTGRRGDFQAARRHLDVADSLFRSLDQKEQYGSVRSLKAEILGAHGETGPALDELVAALPLFGRDGGNMHQNLLSIAGRMIATRHPHAALAFHREGLVLSEGRENPQYRVEALIRLAQAEARAGQGDRAVQHLAEARAGLPTIPEDAMRERVRAEYDELVGMYVPGLEAPLRDSLLTAAVAHFDALDYAFKIPALLERRGRHRLETGRIEEGRSDLRRTVLMTDSQLVETMSPARRASLVQARADAVDALVESHLGVGDTVAALVDRDRARAAASIRTAGFWDSPRGSDLPLGDAVAAPTPDGAVIAYAVVGPRVLAWTVGPSGIHMTELPVTSEELGLDVARLRFLLQSGASVEAVAALAGRLHAALIEPLAPRLEGADRLMIVPDGPLHGLPFGVLGDRPGAMLEDFGLTHAPSVAFALGGAGGAERAAGTSAGAVSAPSSILSATAAAGTDPRYSSLPVLRFAEQEAAEVAALHGVAPVRDPMTDELATSLEEATLFHFAGHGLFRSDRPDLSELVLPGDAGGLPASLIAGLDLSGMELAVLAACSTQEADDGRSGGLSGLTWSFLEAGAGGVIGSLWAVPDAATSALMVRLHERLAAGEHPADALRAVQSAAAESGEGGWGWAAFRYEGTAAN